MRTLLNTLVNMINSLRRRNSILRPKPRFCLLIAALMVLSTPTLAFAQGYSASVDASTTSAGSNKKFGNYIVPGGGYSLSVSGGAQAEVLSLTVELQYQSGGVWTSWNPKKYDTVTYGAGTWSSPGWIKIGAGYYYRVNVVMNFRFKLNAGDDWTNSSTDGTFDTNFP